MPASKKTKKKKRSQKKRYESCVRQVKAKQTKKCLKQRAWGERIDGKMCYSPWAVCTVTVGRPKPPGPKPKIRIGPRGGRYIIRKGVKVYIRNKK